jgi:general secretion pathway protein E
MTTEDEIELTELVEDGGNTNQENVDPPEVDLLSQMPTIESLQLVPEEFARKYNALPLSIQRGNLVVAMANTGDVLAIQALSALTKMRIRPVPAAPTYIRESIDFNYGGMANIIEQFDITLPRVEVPERISVETGADAPVTRALNLIIEEAIKSRASDIHIEPEENRVRIRYRIDGRLHEVLHLPQNSNQPIISRIKVLANMNIADYHRSQDGQFQVSAGDRNIDIRVATAYTANGEMAVLRLLDKSTAALTLSQLGLLPASLVKYEQMLKAPFGMILVSGPTGAGKTTSLYASVNSLDRLGRHIITIEDPVEYHFESVNQIQVNERAGITFANGLRAILRLDPDIILVGEIRDAETAEIAVQAALTGHLVLSSVHANDTVGVLFRLIDLGVEPFLISSAVIGVVAQRMVRRVCPYCAKSSPVPVREQLAYYQEMGEERTDFSSGSGCRACINTGYLGRTGIFEILTMTNELRQQLVSNGSPTQLRAEAMSQGLITLATDGMTKAKMGITTPSEVLRNAYYVE